MRRAQAIQPDLTGLGLLVVQGFLFGAANVATKFAFRHGTSVANLLTVRFTLGPLVLWGIALAQRSPRRLPQRQVVMLLGMGVLLAAGNGLFFESLKRLPVSTASLVLFLYPSLVALAGLVLGRERIGLTKLIALALALAGVTLVLGTPDRRLDLQGVLLALGTACTFASYVLIAQKAILGVNMFVATATVMTGSTAVLLPVAFIAGLAHLGMGTPALLWALLVSGANSLGFITFLLAIERLGSIRASIGGTLEPVVTVLLATLLLGEFLSGPQMLGGALVVAAVAMLPFVERQPAALPM